jgi:hypothetical protein
MMKRQRVLDRAKERRAKRTEARAGCNPPKRALGCTL